MSDKSAIEWTDATWNPTTGCTKVSPGCDRCYAESLYNRFNGPGAFDVVSLRPERLDVPLRWRKPRRVFVNSMSDLFHDAIYDGYIAQVFAVMALTARHTFQVLTKRHGRMKALLSSESFWDDVAEHATDRIGRTGPFERWQLDLGGERLAGDSGLGGGWSVVKADDGNIWQPPRPLPNVWLGVSVEDQHWADIRIPALLATPAAVRFLLCEPLLGPIDLLADGLLFPDEFGRAVDWVIAGGESGAGARPMDPEWVRMIRDDCEIAGPAFFFKQWGGRTPKSGGRLLDGRTWDEYPDVATVPA